MHVLCVRLQVEPLLLNCFGGKEMRHLDIIGMMGGNNSVYMYDFKFCKLYYFDIGI